MAKWKYVTAGLCLLLLSSGGMSQTGSNQIVVSISTSNTTFTSDAETTVKTKIVNRSEQTITIDSSRTIRIMLPHPRHYLDCHRADCFASYYSLGQNVSI